MLMLTLRDLFGLFLFGWVAGFLSAVGLYIWIARKERKKAEDTDAPR